MRWMRQLTLAGIALTAGCLGPRSITCDEGYLCPANLACAKAPVFCEAPAQVEACLGANIADYQACTFDGVAGACRGGACYPCTNELAGCSMPGWVQMTSNTTVELRGVWAASPIEAYAVGGNTVVRYDGQQWTPESIPNVVLNAVWGSDSDHVFATTDDGAIYQRSESGEWGVVHMPTVALFSLSGSGADEVVALSAGAVLRSWTSWASEMVPTMDRFYAIAVRSRDDLFIAGTRGTILRYTGGAWTTSRAGVAGGGTLNAISVTPTGAFAIGDGDSTPHSVLRLPPGQTTWTSTPLDGVPNTFFKGIWANSDDEAFAVGASGRIIRYTGTWSVVQSGTGNTLNAIHGSDRTNLFAVGVGGVILHYTGE